MNRNWTDDLTRKEGRRRGNECEDPPLSMRQDRSKPKCQMDRWFFDGLLKHKIEVG